MEDLDLRAGRACSASINDRPRCASTMTIRTFDSLSIIAAATAFRQPVSRGHPVRSITCKRPENAGRLGGGAPHPRPRRQHQALLAATAPRPACQGGPKGRASSSGAVAMSAASGAVTWLVMELWDRSRATKLGASCSAGTRTDAQAAAGSLRSPRRRQRSW